MRSANAPLGDEGGARNVRSLHAEFPPKADGGRPLYGRAATPATTAAGGGANRRLA
jgi:hypothetical protein